MGNVPFTPDQRQEIAEGTRDGLDVSIYAKPEFLAIQMRQIRLGLMEHLPVEIYATVDYDWFQMEEIRKGLKAGLDVKKYADPDVPFDKMRQIRKGLESGFDLSPLKKLPAGVLKELRIAAKEKIDISKYIKEGYVQEQLEQIRIAKENGVDIDPYISLMQRGPVIREIALGLEKGLDVSDYANEEMNWQQMREIRLGLEKRLDVSAYENILYSWQQMREIRLGLEKGLPVEEYSSFMYTAREMKKRRLKLLSGNKTRKQEDKEQFRDFALLLSADLMEADIVFSNENVKVSKDQILAALKEKGVVVGIDYNRIGELEKEETHQDMVNVARGREPSKGQDGWYEFFFDIDIKKKPKILENGTVDYQNIKWFEHVKRKQKIAYYHEATAGAPGVRINGEEIPGIKGKELLPLQGRGIFLLRDRKTYVAALDGKVEYKDGKLEVTNMLVVGDVTNVTGNVEFNGSVYVQGVVTDGMVIRATKDVLIDGFTEAAIIEAGGDVILRKGNNAGGKGYIKAEGDVMGNFFENAKVYAGGDVKANYCLNSEIVANRDIVISGKISTIAGGYANAGMSIESHDIGNPAGLYTRISLGKEENLSKKRAQIELKKESVKKEITLLKNAYLDFQKKYPAEIRNTNSMYLKIEDAIYTKELEQKKLLNEEEQLQQEMENSKGAKVVVKGMLHQGVQVNINGAHWNANDVMNVTLRKIDNRVGVFRNS